MFTWKKAVKMEREWYYHLQVHGLRKGDESVQSHRKRNQVSMAHFFYTIYHVTQLPCDRVSVVAASGMLFAGMLQARSVSIRRPVILFSQLVIGG